MSDTNPRRWGNRGDVVRVLRLRPGEKADATGHGPGDDWLLADCGNDDDAHFYLTTSHVHGSDFCGLDALQAGLMPYVLARLLNALHAGDLAGTPIDADLQVLRAKWIAGEPIGDDMTEAGRRHGVRFAADVELVPPVGAGVASELDAARTRFDERTGP